MAYIGREPQIGNFQVCDAISVVNNQAAYTMQVGGVNVSPETANHMLVSLNGILQAPTSSFTVSGSTITFASNLVTGDVINFIQILGNVLDLGVPSDNTVTTAKIVDANVTTAKMFSGFANGITEADQWRLNTTLTSVTDQYITANLERVDNTGWEKLGTGMSESSGVFTFPSTGIYLVSFTIAVYSNTTDNFVDNEIHVTTDNSSYNLIARGYAGYTASASNSATIQTLIDVTNTSNVKVKFYVNSLQTTTNVSGTTDSSRTGFTFIRLGDT